MSTTALQSTLPQAENLALGPAPCSGLYRRYLREDWDDLMTFDDFCERVKNEPCQTCQGTRQIQTTEWPALYDACPDCQNA